MEVDSTAALKFFWSHRQSLNIAHTHSVKPHMNLPLLHTKRTKQNKNSKGGTRNKIHYFYIYLFNILADSRKKNSTRKRNRWNKIGENKKIRKKVNRG